MRRRGCCKRMGQIRHGILCSSANPLPPTNLDVVGGAGQALLHPLAHVAAGKDDGAAEVGWAIRAAEYLSWWREACKAPAAAAALLGPGLAAAVASPPDGLLNFFDCVAGLVNQGLVLQQVRKLERGMVQARGAEGPQGAGASRLPRSSAKHLARSLDWRSHGLLGPGCPSEDDASGGAGRGSVVSQGKHGGRGKRRGDCRAGRVARLS